MYRLRLTYSSGFVEHGDSKLQVAFYCVFDGVVNVGVGHCCSFSSTCRESCWATVYDRKVLAPSWPDLFIPEIVSFEVVRRVLPL